VISVIQRNSVQVHNGGLRVKEILPWRLRWASYL